MTTFMIVELSQNPFDDDHVPTDPEAFYSWGLAQVGSNWTTSSGFSYSKVMLLMKHFNVAHASQLVGKTFESEKYEATSALDLLLVQIAHGGKYTPPSTQTVRNRALASLANMECPDFSDLDDETVAKAFAEVWGGWEADEEWLADFTKKLDLLGGVLLRKADYNTFSMRVKGPASYLELVKGDKVQKIILGPYSTPISFEK